MNIFSQNKNLIIFSVLLLSVLGLIGFYLYKKYKDVRKNKSKINSDSDVQKIQDSELQKKNDEIEKLNNEVKNLNRRLEDLELQVSYLKTILACDQAIDSFEKVKEAGNKMYKTIGNITNTYEKILDNLDIDKKKTNLLLLKAQEESDASKEEDLVK